MSEDPQGKAPEKSGLHPRNRHAARYDFPQLIAANPDLAPFLTRTPDGEETTDFANPAAVIDLIKVGTTPMNDKLDMPELAAWTTIASMILNLDETITKG